LTPITNYTTQHDALIKKQTPAEKHTIQNDK